MAFMYLLNEVLFDLVIGLKIFLKIKVYFLL